MREAARGRFGWEPLRQPDRDRARRSTEKGLKVADSMGRGPQREAAHKARAYRDAVAKHMTPAQMAEADDLAREWKPK